MEKTENTTQLQSSSSRSSSRRTSGTIGRESLPSPPPDPRIQLTDGNANNASYITNTTNNTNINPTNMKTNVNTNIKSNTSLSANENTFKYPPEKDLPTTFHSLLDYAEQADAFYKSMHQAIAQDCGLLQATLPPSPSFVATPTKPATTASATITPTDVHGDGNACTFCQRLGAKCEHLIDPLQQRLGLSVGAALSAYAAVDQLNRLYALWDQYYDLEQRLRKQKECVRYVNQLDEKLLKSHALKEPTSHVSDTEAELEQSIALLGNILANEHAASLKRSSLKQHPRERSKSFMVDDLNTINTDTEYLKNPTTGAPILLRRQSTYSDGKSKVSKWTKVKAAFKWERANVAGTAGDANRDMLLNGIGLSPNNHEVARYLRVPTAPIQGGASSADSILSSSSGHLLSETGTPGTISSASSMDDIDSSCRVALRRDSTKSDNRSDARNLADDEQSITTVESRKPEHVHEQLKQSNKYITTSQRSSLKCKVVPDFETLPENVVAELKSTPIRKTKPPLSPLNLNIKQDFNELDVGYSPHSLKSPKDGMLGLQHARKIHSPGNSSVPSSPSRHSNFFAEFESEDLSSGDFSEPTSPSTRKSFQQQQDEINQRYQLLRAKLDKEFEAKRREWEKIKSTPNAYRALSLVNPMKTEEWISAQPFNVNISAKLLEENLTPEFKKKFRKWRVKKQSSIGGLQSHAHPVQPVIPPNSPQVTTTTEGAKAKIDWNLWKTGQLKLEGQGLSPLPDQKDLPEEFQKKLEQWKKIKRGGSVAYGSDSIKRSSKHGSDTKKTTDEAAGEKEKRPEKHKTHEKDKLEKLAKLKAIVTDHPAKEIEVQTSEGVMKFEGISRKFTRKLYEWEKARGIGPESSTFALLHPGYCPIDVRRITKELKTSENSPTLSRSLSLDSIAPNNILPMTLSQQASSLSLNDVNELKEIDEGASSTDVLAETTYKKCDEPEAVMVEVEDHIVETASPLITAHTLIEQQTPVYKYEEGTCNDICNAKHIQSYESHTNLAPLLAVLKRSDEIFNKLHNTFREFAQNDILRQCEQVLNSIRNLYPYYTENLLKANVLNAISDAQGELCRLSNLQEKSPLDEACCQEIMEERVHQYIDELKGLLESLELLKQRIHGGSKRHCKDMVPDINITSADMHEPVSSVRVQTALRNTSSSSAMDENNKSTPTVTTNSSCGSSNITTTVATSNNSTNVTGLSTTAASIGIPGKKKRLRKMGSRQNSKTESSDTSEDETQSVLEASRRAKRKTYRMKQRSLDDDYRRLETGDNTLYMLKVNPGQTIQEWEGIQHPTPKRATTSASPATRKLNERTESCVELGALQHGPQDPQGGADAPSAQREKIAESEKPINANANVFVKTKRKLFTTVTEPYANFGIALVEHDVDSLDNQQMSAKKDDAAKQESIRTITEAMPLMEESGKPRASTTSKHRKSLSLDDVRESEYDDDERRCHSVDSISDTPTCHKQQKGVRAPLATDSFRVINKSNITLNRETRALQRAAALTEQDYAEHPRRQNRYKKHTEKINAAPYGKSVGATIKKIETKIARTNSGSSVEHGAVGFVASTPDKIDNTLPRIRRKLERKTHSPPSTPNSPNTEDAPVYVTSVTLPLVLPAPRTPLSERAQRLQQAKEHFLQNKMAGLLANKGSEAKSNVVGGCVRRSDIVRNETWEQYRSSDNSLSSVATTPTGAGENMLPKSFSADTFSGSAAATDPTPTQSDAGTDVDTSNCDSLPRAVSRSGRLSSKLGLATLASKFRRGKPKKSKESSIPISGSGSALSELCRHSLMVDVISAPQIAYGADQSNECVRKSQSSPHTAYGAVTGTTEGSITGQVRREIERLNKSQSEQFTKRQKESLV